MTKKLLVHFWITEDGVFGRVTERDLCLHTNTLEELAAIVEEHCEVSLGLALTPGEALPEEALG